MDDLGLVTFILRTLCMAGVEFSHACFVAFPRPLAHRDRVALRAALAATEDGWRRAWDDAPAERREHASGYLSALWAERIDDAEPVGDLVASR